MGIFQRMVKLILIKMNSYKKQEISIESAGSLAGNWLRLNYNADNIKVEEASIDKFNKEITIVLRFTEESNKDQKRIQIILHLFRGDVIGIKKL